MHSPTFLRPGYRMHALCAAMAMALCFGSTAWAGDVCDLASAGENGNGATAPGAESLACGTGSEASVDYATAIGHDSKATGTASTALGDGSQALAGAATAIGQFAQATGNNSTALGAGSDALDYQTVAVGVGSRAMLSQGTAVGANSLAWSINSSAFGYDARAMAEQSVAIGNKSVADRANTVSVGDIGSERQIVNVAAGTQATDAVNVSQLQATLATANAYTDTAVATGGTAANAYTDDREAAIRNDMDTGDAATLSAANSYTDQRIGEIAAFDPAATNSRLDGIDQQLNVHDRRINTVGALGAALSLAVPDARVQGANQFSVGVGHFRNRQALGVGYSRLVSPRAAVRVSAAFADGENAAGVGLNVGW